MKDLLARLGKRVHELRAAKGWSQEEFAHVAGLHRTYIGQIERGEKNISFGNLVKLTRVLGVTLSELLSRLEEGGAVQSRNKRNLGRERAISSERRLLEVQKLVKRLGHQRAEMDRTITVLEELTVGGSTPPKDLSGRHAKQRG